MIAFLFIPFNSQDHENPPDATGRETLLPAKVTDPDSPTQVKHATRWPLTEMYTSEYPICGHVMWLLNCDRKWEQLVRGLKNKR